MYRLHRPLLALLLLLTIPHLRGADQAEREALRYNDAVTKLMQARDEAVANQKAKVISALTVMAKTRTKAEDAAGAAEAWKAILSVDREHADAKAYFTTAGTLDAVLAELDAKPTDLLGLDTGDAATAKGGTDAKDKEATKTTKEKAP
jgi:Tfp pilus assembly protein FimT